MKAVVSIIYEGAAPLFCLELPRGAVIRQVAAKTVPGQFGGEKIMTAIFVEACMDDDMPTEYRMFGWSRTGEAIGKGHEFEGTYVGSAFAKHEYWLYEFKEMPASQKDIDLIEQQKEKHASKTPALVYPHSNGSRGSHLEV